MNTFFRGYVKTKDKASVMKFSPGADLLSESDAEKLEEYAGVLADDAVLIDFDDALQGEIALDYVDEYEIPCLAIKTGRGYHLYFRNKRADGSYIIDKCATGVPLACGLVADIKAGMKPSYAVLKYDGVVRRRVYDKLPDEEYAPVPDAFRPVRTDVRFYGMREGDGRNSAYFSYILTLQNIGLGVEESRDIIRFINRKVVADRLPERELETILRDGAFQKPAFFRGETFLFDEFAKYLLSKYNIIKVNGQLHIYKDGVYEHDTSAIEHNMVVEIPRLSRARRQEVLSYLEVLIEEDKEPSDARYIAFNNGIYDVVEDKLLPFSNDLVILNKIAHDYIPDAYSELGDRILDSLSCHDSDIRALLEEVLGYPMYRRQELRKSFLFVGKSRGGKSTFISMLMNILGDRNVTSLDLNELGERFKTAELFGKLANLGDDISDEFVQNPSIFKKVVSGDRLTAERKGQDPFDFNNYAKMIFSCNDIPRIKDRSGAVLDRLVIVPFEAEFRKDSPDYDPFIKYKLKDEAVVEYLIRVGIEGLRRVLSNQAFTECEKVRDRLMEYNLTNNPVLGFFAESDGEDWSFRGQPCTVVYRRYTEYCVRNGFQAISSAELSRLVRERYSLVVGFAKEAGRTIRVYKTP